MTAITFEKLAYAAVALKQHQPAPSGSMEKWACAAFALQRGYGGFEKSAISAKGLLNYLRFGKIRYVSPRKIGQGNPFALEQAYNGVRGFKPDLRFGERISLDNLTHAQRKVAARYHNLLKAHSIPQPPPMESGGFADAVKNLGNTTREAARLDIPGLKAQYRDAIKWVQQWWQRLISGGRLSKPPVQAKVPGFGSILKREGEAFWEPAAQMLDYIKPWGHGWKGNTGRAGAYFASLPIAYGTTYAMTPTSAGFKAVNPAESSAVSNTASTTAQSDWKPANGASSESEQVEPRQSEAEANPLPQTPTATPTSPASPISWPLIAVATIALGGGGLLAYQAYQTKKKKKEQEEQAKKDRMARQRSQLRKLH